MNQEQTRGLIILNSLFIAVIILTYPQILGEELWWIPIFTLTYIIFANWCIHTLYKTKNLQGGIN